MTLKSSLSTTDCVSAASSKTSYLHRCIASRAFRAPVRPADYIEVTGATMGDGLLVIASCPRRSSPAAFRSMRAPSCLLAASPPARSSISERAPRGLDPRSRNNRPPRVYLRNNEVLMNTKVDLGTLTARAAFAASMLFVVAIIVS